jgi:hypothetical protein
MLTQTKGSTMNLRLIRYPTKPGRAADNRALIEGVFKELAEAKPLSVRYLVLELEDGSFIHLVEAAEGDASITGLPAFKVFAEGGRELRSEPPQLSAVKVVGNYRVLQT